MPNSQAKLDIFENFLWQVWEKTPKDFGLRKVYDTQTDLCKAKGKKVYTKKKLKRLLRDYAKALKELE